MDMHELERASLDEDTGRTLGVGLILWIAAVASAAATGGLDAFAAEERLALGAFGTVFAVAAYRLDEKLGPFVRGHRRLGTAAALFDIATVIGLATPLGAILLASVPLGVAAHLALYDRGRRAPARAITSPAAKSPGARPAAT